MFLVAFTKNRIADKLKSFDFVERKANSFIATIVTDNFLSKCFQKQDGFSIIESPLISTSYFNDIIFSEVVYSDTDNRLYVFKSTISGRPIYYHISSAGDFFCSTHISLLRKAGVPIEENTDVLPEFFVYRFVMPPRTLYRNIRQLIAGSRLHLKLASGKCEVVHIDQYEPPIPAKKSNTIDNVAARTLDFLNKSIQTLAPCKDKMSVLLSGGIDSSILCRMCQDAFGIRTSYSTAYPFENPNLNTEKKYALSAAKAFGMDHHYYESTNEDYLTGFLEAISSVEEPLHHLQSVMLYLLFKEGLPKKRDIVVSGESADGIFGLSLHNSIFRGEKFKLLSKQPFWKLLNSVCGITGRGQGLATSLNYYSNTQLLPLSNVRSIIWSLGAYGSEDWVCHYFDVNRKDIINGRYDIIKSFEDRSIYDIISIYSFFFGSGSISQWIWSKLGESQRKIIYYPFSNMDLLNYVFSIPWNVKLKKPKGVLRGVARQLKIPEFIITRPKSPFGIRDKSWSEKGGVFEPLVPLASKVFDEKQIRDMQSTEPKKAMTFWNILNYSIWKRLCINNEPLTTLLEELHESISRQESFYNVKKKID